MISIVDVKMYLMESGFELPSYQSDDAAGMDLHASLPIDMKTFRSDDVILMPGERKLIPCGFKMELPRGFEAQIRPRSGLAYKHGVTVLNSPGTIDADYRGEVMALLINHGTEPFTIKRGDRIAQMVIASVMQCAVRAVWSEDHLDSTGRGAGGLGSTGQ